MKPSIIRLRALEKQLYAYLYAMTVIDFDAETVAPEGSADGRAEATEVLSRASFDLLVNDGTAALLKEAAADAETEQERAEVRNLQRQYDEIARIPADEYAAFTKLCSQSVPAWTKAKRTNDFSLFAPYLEKLIAALGGRENICTVDNCFTRLRVTVNDPAFVKEQALKALPCSGVVQSGCDVQIVYGIRAPEVRQAVERRLNRVVC